MAEPTFWDNQEAARATIEEANKLKSWVEPWKALHRSSSDLAEMADLLELEPDEELEAEWGQELKAVVRKLEALELQNMLQGDDDHRDAILTINPGAGGLESQDWAEMLLRMYQRWAERRGFSISVLDLQPAEEAGIKSATPGDQRGPRLRVFEIREGSPSAGPDLPLRFPIPPPHLLRLRVRIPRHRRRNRDRDR